MKIKLLFIVALCLGALTIAVAQVETEIDHDLLTIGQTISINGDGVGNGGQILLKTDSGDIRVGLFAKLNTTSNQGGFLELINSLGNRTFFANAHDSNKGGKIQLTDSLGNVRMTLHSNYSNSGDSRVVTDEIQINGGSDLAELFDITDAEDMIEPGLLVSLDPEHPGKLMLSKKAYDTKVAGVISGANGVKPGIMMGQDETIATGDDLVTLTGRTFVLANASNGAIKVGDLMTTSDVPGQAMKATKRNKSKGAVVGKAMTNLNDGAGYILLLVNLQ